MMLAQNDNPFHSLEHDHDPIMVAAHLQSASQSSTTTNVRWRYCTEGIPPIQPDYTTLEQPLNIIALGRTGDGKSSLLNDIIGHPVFKQKTSVKVNRKRNKEKDLLLTCCSIYSHRQKRFKPTLISGHHYILICTIRSSLAVLCKLLIHLDLAIHS